MNNKILIVDDETNILSSLRRQLRGKFDLLTASSGKEGLSVLESEKDIAVVVSDYKMPEMNGVEFLSEVKRIRPDIVSMMLTGQADMQAVINVINEGNIFRFLSKPCPPELLEKNLNDGLEQFRLIHAEKELLSKTLGGTLRVLSDLLILAKPQAFNRGLKIKDIVKKILANGDFPNPWQIEIAAILSQIGCITVPDNVIAKVVSGQPLTDEERRMFQKNIRTSSEMIRKIPRLEHVADIILYQDKYYDGTGFPADSLKGDEIPVGSGILRAAIDFEKFLQSEADEGKAFVLIRKNAERYDSRVLDALKNAVYKAVTKKKFIIKDVMLEDLTDQMFLAKEITTTNGVTVGTNKQRVTRALMVALENYFNSKEISEPISVLCCMDE